MTDWTFADIYEEIAAAIPDAPCQVNGERVTTWAEMDRRANAFAADLLDAGLQHQSKMAAYLYNGVEYLESYIAAFKGGFAPVNTNYRYGPEEIVYLFDNADAEVVLFHASFTPLLEGIRSRLPKVRRWYVVPDESGDGPDWAVPYESVVAAGADRVVAPWGRSGDDLLLLYTGGTTGMPKGVMWRQDDLFNVLGAGGQPLLGLTPVASAKEAGDAPEGEPRPSPPGHDVRVPAHARHGPVLVVHHDEPRRLRGDPARPQVRRGRALADVRRPARDVAHHRRRRVRPAHGAGARREPGHVRPVVARAHQLVRRHVEPGDQGTACSTTCPNVMLFDSFGSTEAVGMGASLSTKRRGERDGGVRARRAGRSVHRGRAPRRSRAATSRAWSRSSGFLPAGYYKDEAKTRRRPSARSRASGGAIPGDWAQVNADGTLHLLGRGSVCINTGGEKVFPEEVEEVLKLHPAVRDAVCVGIPDERFGETICAVVEPSGSVGDIDADSVIAHVKASLAAYKAPRNVVVVETIGRSPDGKVDYKGLKALAADRLARLSWMRGDDLRTRLATA